MDLQNENKRLELNQVLYNKCLEFMDLRKLSPKTKVLYLGVLDKLFKEKNLSVSLYDEYMKKGNYFKSVLQLIEDTAYHYDIPFKKYKKVKQQTPPRKIPKVYSRDEMENFILKMKTIDKRISTIMQCAFYIGGGLRFGSALFLRWSEFNWSEWVMDKSKNGKVEITVAKGGKQSSLPVEKILMEILYDIAEKRNKVIAGIPYNPNFSTERDYIFLRQKKIDKVKKNKINDSKEQKAFNIEEYLKKEWDAMNYKMKKLSKALGTKKIKFHSIRHSKAKDLLDKGLSIIEVSKLLMHTNLETTKIYLQITDKELHDKFDKFVR